MKHLLNGISTLVIAAALGTAASAQGAGDPIQVTVAYDGFTMTSAPLQYVQENGIFEKYGLDVDLLFVEGGSVLTQSLVGGSVDIAQNGYAPVINAAVAGADVVIVGGIANVLPMMLVVDGSVRSADDLRGKAIAISRYGSSTDVAARFALEELGMTAADVNILQLGYEGTRLAAFKSGQVAGLMVQLPGAQDLIDEGANMLVDVGNIHKSYPNTSFAATREFVAENPEALKRFYMAMAEGIREFKANPEAATKITAAFLKTHETPNLQKAVEYFSDKVYQADLQPSLDGVAAVLTELSATVPAAAEVKPESLVDTTVLDQLGQEGFFASLNN